MKKVQSRAWYVAKINGRTVDVIGAVDLDDATEALTAKWKRTCQGHAELTDHDVSFVVEKLKPAVKCAVVRATKGEIAQYAPKSDYCEACGE